MKMSELLLDKVIKDLRTLLLKDMAKELESGLQRAAANGLGHLQFLSEMLDIQLAARQKRSLQRRIQHAVFPTGMSFDNFDWGFQPGLNVEHLKNLQELGFVQKKSPLLISGKSGTGKTHIATSIGIKACAAGFKVRFYTLQQILAMLYATLADDTTDELLSKLSKLDILIVDHINHIRTKPEYPSLLLDLVSVCQEKVSLILTTSISIEEWGHALGNPSVIGAVADRIFHRAEVLMIRKGRSYRTEGPEAPKIHPESE
jgi:DNA replication protein DnaC